MSRHIFVAVAVFLIGSEDRLHSNYYTTHSIWSLAVAARDTITRRTRRRIEALSHQSLADARLQATHRTRLVDERGRQHTMTGSFRLVLRQG
jgi:hypothetical protein